MRSQDFINPTRVPFPVVLFARSSPVFRARSSTRFPLSVCVSTSEREREGNISRYLIYSLSNSGRTHRTTRRVKEKKKTYEYYYYCFTRAPRRPSGSASALVAPRCVRLRASIIYATASAWNVCARSFRVTLSLLFNFYHPNGVVARSPCASNVPLIPFNASDPLHRRNRIVRTRSSWSLQTVRIVPVNARFRHNLICT